MIKSSKHGKLKSTKIIASIHKLSAKCETLLGEHDLQRGGSARGFQTAGSNVNDVTLQVFSDHDALITVDSRIA